MTNLGTVSHLCLLYYTAGWEDRWVQSTHKSDYGKFKWTAGNFYGDAEKDKGEWIFNFI